MPFNRSRIALLVFDAGRQDRSNAWARAECAADVGAAEHADRVADLRLTRAFWRDTRHINGREVCRRVGDDFIRQMVREHSEPVTLANLLET